LADRFNILNWLKNNDTSALQVGLSVQTILNCKAGGTCSGGMALAVYRFAKTHGIPHSSCENYIAHDIDNPEEVCSGFNVCRDCKGPAPPVNSTGFENCWAVDSKNYYVSGYKSVIGPTEMKKEIVAHGPIACGMQVTERFELDYHNEIYEEKLLVPIMNHIVSIVGYGVSEEGTEYWIGRNSWGTYWGDLGFFKIKMHKHNLGIETACLAGYPTYDAPSVHEETE